MCRPKSAGGRRCPAHSTPEYRAKENARRRAAYAAKKNAPGAAFGITIKRTGEANLYSIGKKLTGVLRDEDINQLYKTDAFGFQEALENYHISAADFYVPSVAEQYRFDIISHSREDLKQLTRDEDMSIKTITTDFHKSLHKYLINGKEDPDLELFASSEMSPQAREEAETNTDLNIWKVQGLLAMYSYKWLPENGYKLLINNIDNGISKATNKNQKILYRGLPAKNNLLPLMELPRGVEAYHPEAKPLIEKHINENITIGQEIVFDSYLSATSHPGAAVEFTDFTGVMCEFLTPHGLEISDRSQYREECETLLPRGQRYKIVGVRNNVDVISTEGAGRTINIISLVAINSKGEILDGTNDDPLPPLPGEKQ